MHSVIVGLDSRSHFDENVAMATGFQPLPEDQKIASIRESQSALAGLIAP